MSSMRAPKRPAGGGGHVDGGHIPDLEEVRANIEKRVFVGRMPLDITEAELRDLFLDIGAVTEIRLLPGKGVAFVGLETWAAAHRAVVAMNGIQHLPRHAEGQTLHVKFAERSGCERTGVVFANGLDFKRLFVGGLPDDFVEEEFETLCMQFGEVKDLYLMPPKGRRRCGFINFSLWGEALDAVEALNGSQLPNGNGEVLKVTFAHEAASRRGLDSAESPHYPSPKHRRVDYPERDMGPSDHQRWLHFMRVRDDYLAALEDGSPRGVCDGLHCQLMDLRTMPYGRGGAGPRHSGMPPRLPSLPSSRRPPSPAPRVAPPPRPRTPWRLFISGLPAECIEDELVHLVNQLPLGGSQGGHELVECRILRGKGSGYVTFASREAASDALSELHDRQVKGWEQPLQARWAEGEASPDRGPRRAAAPAPPPPGDAEEINRRRLFVGQIQSMEDGQERMHELFEPFGPIEECRYLDRKGVCFVTFEQEVDAEAAVNEMNGATIAGVSRNEGLSVKVAQQRRS
mmetsp:Transcript_74999/g.219704  ORF Transcript_74999/g.219704 Transcript_74999/m.219704 type:complete len:515 (+) Transcript_74999:58-1602(+)